jgi:hypothetical protein
LFKPFESGCKEKLVKKITPRLAWVFIPFISGCQTGTPLDDYLPAGSPIVSGYPAAPPRHVKSVVVWGNDGRTVAAAAAWVKEHGLTVVHRDRIQQMLANKAAAEDLTLLTEAAIVDAAGAVGADAVVFADRMGDVRPPMVSVKGIDARTGRLIWSGDARYDTFHGLPGTEAMTLLTDQALMTAWGLQPKED